MRTIATSARYDGEIVRQRPVFHAEFGVLLQRLRKEKKWTMRQAAAIAHKKHLTAVTRQVLLRLEKGQVKNPDPAVLRGIAALYDYPYELLAREFAFTRYGIVESDLPGHNDPTESVVLSSYAPDNLSSSSSSSEVSTRGETDPLARRGVIPKADAALLFSALSDLRDIADDAYRNSERAAACYAQIKSLIVRLAQHDSGQDAVARARTPEHDADVSGRDRHTAGKRKSGSR